jgi:hypothetical protein
MSNRSATIVQRLWNYCNILRDDGVSATTKSWDATSSTWTSSD